MSSTHRKKGQLNKYKEAERPKHRGGRFLTEKEVDRLLTRLEALRARTPRRPK